MVSANRTKRPWSLQVICFWIIVLAYLASLHGAVYFVFADRSSFSVNAGAITAGWVVREMNEQGVGPMDPGMYTFWFPNAEITLVPWGRLSSPYEGVVLALWPVLVGWGTFLAIRRFKRTLGATISERAE